MARRAERAILDICEREATPPAGMPRAESRYRNSRYGPLAKLRLKPPRGSASLDCCLLALAPLGRHLLRASETCFIPHDVGLRRWLGFGGERTGIGIRDTRDFCRALLSPGEPVSSCVRPAARVI